MRLDARGSSMPHGRARAREDEAVFDENLKRPAQHKLKEEGEPQR
jgi:hypothetical protein